MNKHAGTAGHSIATAIMGKSTTPNPKSPAEGFDRITIKGHENGYSVEHEPKRTPGKDFDYNPGKQHVFNSADDAHAHVGKIMGLGSGGGKKGAGSLG